MTNGERDQAHRDAAEFLGLIGNEKRLAILKMLLEREMTVGSIADEVSLSQSALSQHLAKLRSAGLVEARQQSTLVWYSCNSDSVRRTLRTLDGIFPMIAATADLL